MEARATAKRTFASAAFVWLRSDQTREAGLSYWRGPHGSLVAGNPAFKEYRQHYFDPDRASMWPRIEGVQTDISDERRIDGMPEVTFHSPLSIVRSLRSNSRIKGDEANVFRRTVLHLTTPSGGRWFIAHRDAPIGARCLVLFRRRADVSRSRFASFIHDELAPTFAVHDMLELRTLVFLPWLRALWDSPNVAHDYPACSRYHAVMIMGAADERALSTIIHSQLSPAVIASQSRHCSAIHAYAVERTHRLLPSESAPCKLTLAGRAGLTE